jgi:hypothetical protein
VRPTLGVGSGQHFCSSASATGKSPFAIFAADVYLCGGEPSPGADVARGAACERQKASATSRCARARAVGACSGCVQWVRAVGARACVQWVRAVGACSGCVQWVRAVGACSGCVQWVRAVGACSGCAVAARESVRFVTERVDRHVRLVEQPREVLRRRSRARRLVDHACAPPYSVAQFGGQTWHRGEPSPGAEVAGVSPVPAQRWVR